MTASFLNRRSMMSLIATALVAPAAQAGSGLAPRIVASTGMIADAARRLTGTSVAALVPEGADPATYRPTRSDLAELARADLVLWHGPLFETALQRSLRQPVLSRQIAALDARPEADTLYAWLDPDLWQATVAEIHRRVDHVFPQLAPVTATNATAFRSEIEATADRIRSRIDQLSPARRMLVTTDPAMERFGQAFGLDTLWLDGSAQTLAAATRIVTDRALPCAFFTSTGTQAPLHDLAQSCAIAGHSLALAGPVYSRALGPAPADTWLGALELTADLVLDGLSADTRRA